MSRALRVTRIHLTSWVGAFGWPVGILATSFVINLAFFASMDSNIPDLAENHVTGGLGSIYIVELIVCWQAMTNAFGFAVGLNVTRRTYFAGTAIMAVGQALAFSVLLYLLELVEHATDGWGIGLPFFDPLTVTHGNSPINILVYAVPMVLLNFVGLFLGTVTKRWGVNGFFGLMVLSILVLGLLVITISWAHGWSPIWSWIIDQPAFALVVGWALVPTVALAAGTYGLLRRAIP